MGFTLIQYLITLAIICSLCTLAQPNYLQLQHKHLATITLKTIIQCLQYARMQAILHHTAITIAPLKINDHYCLAVNNATLTLKTYTFHKDWKISWTGFGQINNKLEILPNGLTHNNGHFTIQLKQICPITYTLFVSKTLKTHS